MIRKGIQSQIATIIVSIMAVMFLFVLVSLNLGRIAQKKTAIDNVADSVGLNLASQLGSLANVYKHQFKIYGHGNMGNCALNLNLFIGILLVIAGIVSFIFNGPFLLSMAVAALFLIAQGATMQYMANHPAAVSQLKLKFKNLSALQQIIEVPIQSVLFSINEDPSWVTDVYDMDNDGDHSDRIPRFLKWYNLRLNALPDVGSIVDGFLAQGFPGLPYSLFNTVLPPGNNPRFFMQKDANWMVMPGADSVRWWIEYDGVPGRELKIVDWLRNELPGLLSTLRQWGYGINVSVGPTGEFLGIVDRPEGLIPVGPGLFLRVEKYESGGTDGLGVIGSMIGEFEEFENVIARGLSDIDRDTAVQGLDAWAPLLENDSADHWYSRLENLKSRIVALRAKLIERRDQIHSCIYNCARREMACCGSPVNASVCHTTCTTSCTGGYDTDGNCISSTTTCVDDSWWSCDSCGTMRYCGTLCGSSCPPTEICSLPLPNSSGHTTAPCCSIVPLEPGCLNNIIDNSPIHHALTVLQGIIDDINQVQALINSLYTQLKDVQARTYDMAHEAFYLWQDYLGGAAPTRQLVNHIVYARIEDINPRPKASGGDGFELPHMDTKSRWKWGVVPQICLTVDKATGSFRLTVGRYDENPAAQGLLGRFWNLLFSKGPLTAAERASVNQIAARYKSDLAQNIYYEVGGLPDATYAATKALLRNIIASRGIVTKIKVNYGPGYTPNPGPPPESVSAADRNQDIYIIGTSSDMNMR